MFPDLPIVSTGHSLGAAVSAIAALDLREQGFDNVQAWTFGQPRFGNKALAKYFDKMVPVRRRVVNQADLVPHLPLRSLDYYHPSTEVWFSKDYTNYVICDDSGEDPTCSDSLEFYDWRPQEHVLYLGYDQDDGKPHGCGNVWSDAQ